MIPGKSVETQTRWRHGHHPSEALADFVDRNKSSLIFIATVVAPAILYFLAGR